MAFFAAAVFPAVAASVNVICNVDSTAALGSYTLDVLASTSDGKTAPGAVVVQVLPVGMS